MSCHGTATSVALDHGRRTATEPELLLGVSPCFLDLARRADALHERWVRLLDACGGNRGAALVVERMLDARKSSRVVVPSPSQTGGNDGVMDAR